MKGKRGYWEYWGRGTFFGEMALLDDTAASASVCTNERAWLLRLPEEDFEGLMMDYPSLRAELRNIAVARKQRNRSNLCESN